MTEYLIILALVGVASILVIAIFGQQIRNTFQHKATNTTLSQDESNMLNHARAMVKEPNNKLKRATCFFSYAPEDVSAINSFRVQITSVANTISINDWLLRDSFDSEKARFIREGVRDSINQSSLVVVFLSTNAADNAWVDWDAREATVQGKKIIAVYNGNFTPTSVPKAVVEKHIPMFSWDPQLIVSQSLSPYPN